MKTISTYKYEDYGKVIDNKGATDNPFRYSGEYTDDETGFQYLRARYYNPNIRRFVTEDTYTGEITNPLSLNLYAYCAGNPIMYSDPSGNEPISIGITLYLGYLVSSPDLQYDLQFIVDDLASGNYLAVGLDTLGAAIPGVSGLGKAAEGVWNLNPFKRGFEIEKRLGGMVSNFPVIDKVVEGIGKNAGSITSIKSMDITAKSYQKGNKIFKQLEKYINQLDKFKTTNWGKVNVQVGKNTQKNLDLVIPNVNLTTKQIDQFNRATEFASERGIKFNIIMATE